MSLPADAEWKKSSQEKLVTEGKQATAYVEIGPEE
jgi:hypothetical protein